MHPDLTLTFYHRNANQKDYSAFVYDKKAGDGT
jgi:hypothetical protein